MNQTIKNKLKVLPEKPGCYFMKDSNGMVIYVGKAKVLRNRVYSYFVGSHDEKTQRLINEIEDFDYIVTSNNSEALILEMNLIKKNLPKYNVMLKDDKSYPYIKITDERHPRLIITREVKQDKGKYFGPYPNVKAANGTKKMLEHLYPLRRCPLARKRPCLYYQLGQCIGPCAREVSTAEYKKAIDGITRFFNGGYKDIKKQLRDEMQMASESLDFEKAKEVQNKITQIEIIMEQQKMLINEKLDRDVIGYDFKERWMCIQVFFVRKGKMAGREKLLVPFFGEVKLTLLTALKKFYLRNRGIMPNEILCSMSFSEELAQLFPSVKVIVPKRGQKKELVRLANENASESLKEKLYFESV